MSATELVVLSHLPWDFVWQRPQHLISRLGAGRPTWFVEECRVCDDVTAPTLRTADAGPVRRVWLDVPGPARLAGFDDPDAADYPELVAELLGQDPDRTIWASTPMALGLVDALEHRELVYDVMDDLAAFAHASSAMRAEQDRLLARADLVFTGGRSIHAGVVGRTSAPVHRFSSGVDPEHFRPASTIRARRGRERPVAGYVGVIDERLDLDLVAGLAAALADWEIRMVGPVFKIDPGDLPRAPNLVYPGRAAYEELPEVLGGFDVALMPFARNDATRSISPTKTLEYLAAGLPVVSTRVPDVVADFGEHVALADDAAQAAEACRELAGSAPDADALLATHRWDTIAAAMQRLLDLADHEPAPSAGAGVRSPS